MTHAPFGLFNNSNNNNAMPSSSSFKVKRKRMSWGMDEEEASKHMRVRSPTMQNSYQLPELMTDHSNSASDDDQMMDTDMDMDNDNDCHMAMGHSSLNAHSHQEQSHRNNDSDNYVYSSGGSGGFLFGPGAEEDELEYEMEMMDDMGASQMKAAFPSLTPHPNPHHFSNASLSSHHQHIPSNTNFRPTSPFAAQAFSQSLPAPRNGLLQPSYNGPLPANASEIEKARNLHGPHCKSIPKLVMSEYPDATTGRRSMWSVCGDCGACEMAQ